MRSVILSTHICQQRYLLTSLYCCTVQDMQAASRPSLSSHVTSVPCKPDLVASNMQFSFSGPWQAQLEDKHNSGQPGDNSSAVFPLYGRRMYLRQCWSQTASNPINLACACLFRQEAKKQKLVSAFTANAALHSQIGRHGSKTLLLYTSSNATVSLKPQSAASSSPAWQGRDSSGSMRSATHAR